MADTAEVETRQLSRRTSEELLNEYVTLGAMLCEIARMQMVAMFNVMTTWSMVEPRSPRPRARQNDIYPLKT